jgi:hypothetical protein
VLGCIGAAGGCDDGAVRISRDGVWVAEAELVDQEAKEREAATYKAPGAQKEEVFPSLGDSLSSKPSKKKNKGVTVSLHELMVSKLAGRQAAELVHGQREADDGGAAVAADGAAGARGGRGADRRARGRVQGLRGVPRGRQRPGRRARGAAGGLRRGVWRGARGRRGRVRARAQPRARRGAVARGLGRQVGRDEEVRAVAGRRAGRGRARWV